VEAPPVPAVSLAVVGDAEEIETLVPSVAGADALVIEATFLEADAALAASRGHLTAALAGRLAAAAGVGALYLTHLSGRYASDSVAAEAKLHFSRTIAVKDFDRFSVSASRRVRSVPASRGIDSK
jgi:ribonuclease Z